MVEPADVRRELSDRLERHLLFVLLPAGVLDERGLVLHADGSEDGVDEAGGEKRLCVPALQFRIAAPDREDTRVGVQLQVLGQENDVSGGDFSPPDIVNVEAVVELGEVGAERALSIELVDQFDELCDSPSATRYQRNSTMK